MPHDPRVRNLADELLADNWTDEAKQELADYLQQSYEFWLAAALERTA